MKKKHVLFIICFFSLWQMIYAQNEFTNRYWMGIASGIHMPMTLTFEYDSAEFLVPILRSPLQSNEKIIPSKFQFANDTLSVEVSNIGLHILWIYQRSDSTFSGTIKQRGNKFSILLTPSDSLFTISRPQEPAPPYSYIEEDVVFQNGEADVTLSGTLTYPEKGNSFPAVILVSGSGAQNRDEEIFKHKPFKVIADYLTRNGIAVLRYDDRGVGKSTGNFLSSTTLDFAGDANAAIQYLRSHPRINKKKIGIMGHSEGGAIAPIVASQNKHTAFIVLLAGPGMDGKQTLLLQNEAFFSLNDTPDSLIKIRITVLSELFDILDTLTTTNAYNTFDKVVKKHTQTLTKAQRSAIGFSPNEVFALATQLQNKWMRTFLTLDPCPYLKKTKCPILAINGGKDSQVLANENIEAITLCTQGKADSHIFPNLNHMFQNCEKGSVEEYIIIKETFSKEALEFITKWILQTTK